MWAYESARPEVQRHVPLEARRILDLGCSSGRLGEALKARQGAEVVGIEADGDYARDAAQRLDRVIVADIEDLADDPPDDLGRFDCLIAADVLEHLRDPWRALRSLVGLVEPGGTAVLSLPNIRYWETFWILGRWGVWPLRDAGIYDRDHLRWFTRADATHAMEQAGLAVTGVVGHYRLTPEHPVRPWQARLLARVPLGWLFAFQYVLVGVRAGG